jgi:membrane fusion protein (multidrug efflux system)
MGAGELAGTVGAVDPTVDAATRTIKLRASVPNKGEKLRPGMFVRVTVVRDAKLSVVVAPLTAVVHASYGDSVFVLEDKPGADGHPAKFARQQFVRLGVQRGDFVAINDGVKAGQELVTAGAFKLRNGARVVINNDVKPTPSVAPHVENL